MTENIYGMLKTRFPILKRLRIHHENAQRSILSIAGTKCDIYLMRSKIRPY